MPPSRDVPAQKCFSGGSSGYGMSLGDGLSRRRGALEGHPGHGCDLLPIERCTEVNAHHPIDSRRCATALNGDDPEPLWCHQVVEIPPLVPVVVEHQVHCLLCP
ncbi:hypothetical protein KBY67_14320 [Synechococcus sp. RedBA-s]|nr:hypothetical protein [Synechococcus sp. RedBA-s]MCP9801908.1 hypothetical protein [Synechococcus sp. RedBA-s]